MKKILVLCFTLVMSVMLFAGCGGNAAKDNGSGSSAKKIIVGLDDNYPPMGFKDENNEITGFDVDLAKEASKRLDAR